jgi:hypothetical protein
MLELLLVIGRALALALRGHRELVLENLALRQQLTAMTPTTSRPLLQAAGDAGNVARTCRHFAISRKTFYKWRQRYHEHGDIGLADRARAPHRSPRATPATFLTCHFPAAQLNRQIPPSSSAGSAVTKNVASPSSVESYGTVWMR